MVKSREPYGPRIPLVTIVIGLVLLAVFVMESHPHPNLTMHNYFLLAYTSWDQNQLVAELTLLGVGGIIAEQFLARWKLLAYLIVVGPTTIWFAEYIHPNTIVAGLSGATTGLIGFGVLGLLWYWFERPESDLLEVISSAVIGYGSLTAASAVYGILVHAGVHPLGIGRPFYKPGTIYAAHILGFAIGFGYWAFEHFANGTM